MVKDKEIKRLQAKTPQQRFLNVLEQEFHYAPKVAQVLLEEAEACLWGTPGSLRPGQMRVGSLNEARGGSWQGPA